MSMKRLTKNKWLEIKPVKLDFSEKVVWRESGEGPSVLIKQNTFDIVEEFLGSDISREHGGFLIGGIVVGGFQDANFATFVMYAIPCPAASGSLSHLTLDHDCWELVNKHPNIQDDSLSIVGWFHSHPGMPVTMSKKDKFIQSQFFDSPWQIAWIMDPINSVHAMYSRTGSKFFTVPNIGLVESVDQ